MTAGHGHGHGQEPQAVPFPGFRPSGAFAINAQQAQLNAIRAERDKHEDRATFYEACLAQLQAETNSTILGMAEELNQARARIAELEPTTGEVNGSVALDPSDVLIDASLNGRGSQDD